MIRALLTACIIMTSAGQASEEVIKVGSKKFTESVILAEAATQLISESGSKVEHLRELGGTRILFSALQRGDIDIYPEYTGTIRQELLKNLNLSTDGEISGALRQSGIGVTGNLGFNNTYAIGIKPELADSLGIKAISDLVNFPVLRWGLTNEFLDRGDGWPGLKQKYQLPQEDVRGLDHDLAYRALDAEEIDLMDFYSTDAEIAYYGFRILEDNLHYFPTYNAVFLYRLDLKKRKPGVVELLEKFENSLSETDIRTLNAEVKIDGKSESVVAGDFIKSKFGIQNKVKQSSVMVRVTKRTIEHFIMVAVALLLGIFVAIPAGFFAYRIKRLGQLILGMTGILQTIPSLALLVFMIPIFGIGAEPAIAALFLYSLLPMVRNTLSGLENIPPELLETADTLGLSARARLFRIELPLASRSILAGIKTSSVITVGFATLGALIGAGGYGQPILTGIRLDDYGLIMEGAIPAALMALLAQWGFDGLELVLVPRGLRLERSS